MAGFGDVFFHPQFRFDDGTVADKLFVILAETADCYIAAKTTSQIHRRNTTAGCQAMKTRWHSWHIPLGTGRFKDQTWICLEIYYPFLKGGLDRNLARGILPRLFTLDACPVIKCALEDPSLDMTEEQELALRAALITANCPPPPPPPLLAMPSP